MNVYLNEITGIDDAFVSMFMSKRSWTRKLECEIRNVCKRVLADNGALKKDCNKQDLEKFTGWMDSLLKWGWKHITMLRFIDFSITVEGLHRAGQDDWDAHACRFNNRIIRSSTRLADFGNEISEWYEDKILPTDIALENLGLNIPKEVFINGETYVKAINGYVRKDFANDADVKRGLYMLSIPSNFIFKVNLTEWAHVYKERNAQGAANPEVKLCCENIADQLEDFHKQFNRDLFRKIEN